MYVEYRYKQNQFYAFSIKTCTIFAGINRSYVEVEVDPLDIGGSSHTNSAV